MRVKICGITNLDDAMRATELGADAVGFVFYSDSPRAVDPSVVKEIIRRLPPFVTSVGVFANSSHQEILEIVDVCGLDVIQIQGDESPEFCGKLGYRVIKAIRVRDSSSLEKMKLYSVRAFVLDTYREEALGGTGKTFDWGLALDAKRYGSIILAGGLTPENIRDAVDTVRPAGVDVSSGVEREVGIKDTEKVKKFIRTAKEAFSQSSSSKE